MKNSGEPLFNFFFLKSRNGMYYYGVDYMLSLSNSPTVILNKKYFREVPKEIRSANIIFVGLIGLVFYSLLYKKRKWVTPTPHPLPWLSNQIVIFHDIYPFYGRLGIIKKLLLIFSFKINKFDIGIINKQMLIPFLSELKLNANFLYLPNNVEIIEHQIEPRNIKKIEKIGLIGTDSSKKNYHDLIKYLDTNMQYVLYGKDNLYSQNLINTFASEDIQVLDSSSIPIATFFDNVDCIVSVATEEGFGRLNLAAIQYGVPVFLLKSMVTNEFYRSFHVTDSGITVCESLADMSNHLKNPIKAIFKVNEAALIDLSNEFTTGVKRLKNWIQFS